MDDKTRQALVAALKAMDDLKDMLPDDKKTVIEEAGDQIIASLGGLAAGTNGDGGDDEPVGCGAAWLYPA